MVPVSPDCMDLEFYPFSATKRCHLFEFESVSERKRISKRITFAALPGYTSVYNLALMDVDTHGDATDINISNNSDMPKVMATVIRCMLVFLEMYPSATIHIRGNSPSRTRLYRAIIGREISKAKNFLEIYGIADRQIEPFCANTEYDAFLIKKL